MKSLILLLTLALTVLNIGCTAQKSTSQNHTSTANIVNGNPVSPNDIVASSTVDIYLLMPDGHFFNICTGTIIGDKTVLTAAHCLVEPAKQFGTGVQNIAPHLRVVFGTKVVSQIDDPNVIVTSVSSIRVNSEFDLSRLQTASQGFGFTDLAILRLTDSVPATAHVVPLLTDADVLVQGTELKTAGFGCTKPPDASTEATSGSSSGYATGLNQTSITIDDANLNPVQFSFKVINEQSTCPGDSGGPAYWVDQNGEIELAGVTSWGDFHTMGAFTSVPAMLGWILDSI